MILIIMGVAGSGKTTVGLKAAEALGWEFCDADDFHPRENIAKMSAGIPLNDEDRAPWLAAIRAGIDSRLARGQNAVFTCSALKEAYRRAIIADPSQVRLVYLEGDFRLLQRRLGQRQGHFMKPEMLQSQLAALEPPQNALRLDIAETPDALAKRILAAFGPLRAAGGAG